MTFLIIDSDNVISTRVTSTRKITNITIEGIDNIKYLNFKDFWSDFLPEFLNNGGRKEDAKFLKQYIKEKIF